MKRVLEFFSSNKDKKSKSEANSKTNTVDVDVNSIKKVKFQNFNPKIKENDNKNVHSNIFTVNNTL